MKIYGIMKEIGEGSKGWVWLAYGRVGFGWPEEGYGRVGFGWLKRARVGFGGLKKAVLKFVPISAQGYSTF